MSLLPLAWRRNEEYSHLAEGLTRTMCSVPRNFVNLFWRMYETSMSASKKTLHRIEATVAVMVKGIGRATVLKILMELTEHNSLLSHRQRLILDLLELPVLPTTTPNMLNTMEVKILMLPMVATKPTPHGTNRLIMRHNSHSPHQGLLLPLPQPMILSRRLHHHHRVALHLQQMVDITA